MSHAITDSIRAPAQSSRMWLAFVALPPGLYALALTSTGVGGYAAIGILGALVLALVLTALARGEIVLGDRRVLGLLATLAGVYLLFAIANGSITNAATRGAAVVFVSFPIYYLLTHNFVALDGASGGASSTQVLRAFAASAIVTAAIWAGQQGFESGFGMETLGPGLIYNRNHFGYFVAMGYAATLPQALAGRTSWRWLAASALLAAGALGSASRGAWISVALVTLVTLLRTRRYALAAIMPALFGALALGSAFSEKLARDEVSTGRFDLWTKIVPDTLPQWLTGKGVGYLWSLDQYDISEYGGYVSDLNEHVYAHNDFLFLAIELGVFAALLWAIVVGGAAMAAHRRTGQAHVAHDDRVVAWAFLCMTIVLVTGQMVDTMFFGSTFILKWCAALPLAEDPLKRRVLRFS